MAKRKIVNKNNNQAIKDMSNVSLKIAGNKIDSNVTEKVGSSAPKKWNEKITPDIIKEIKKFEVFVFGSNLSGKHGKGAALTAMNYGAVYGQSNGLQGNSYGIPTVNATVTGRLNIEEIAEHVTEFINFAKNNPSKSFLVTEVGCGLAGYGVKDIAPLFKEAMTVDNIKLPIRFWEVLRGRR